MTVTVTLSLRSDVEPAVVLATLTVLPNTILTSQAVRLIVKEVDVRSVIAPLATAGEPGDSDGAPGLGHAAPGPPPPRPPLPNVPKPPGVRDAAALLVLALTLF